MEAPRINPNSLRLAIASVFAFFGFLVAFFIVSDRLGGWPLGHVVAFSIAIVIFVVILTLAPRFVAKPVKSTPRDEGPAPSLESNTAKNRVSEKPATKSLQPPVRRPPAGFVPTPPGIETIFDDIVEVNSGREGCWNFELPLEVGDKLRGTLREVDGYEFGWMILTGEELARFLNGEDLEAVEGDENVRAASIEWELTEDRPWHLVLEAYGKQYTREVRVLLRRVH